MRNAQVAMEFVWMTMTSFVVLLIAIGLFAFHLQGYYHDRNKIYVEEIAYEVQRELLLASEARDGYYRTFFLPHKIGADDLYITLNDTFMLVRHEENALSLRIPEITGFLQVGDNSLKKINGEVQLN